MDPQGYSPLGTENLDPGWIERLGRSGRDCFDAITAIDLDALSVSMNEDMKCWAAILPATVRPPKRTVDLAGLSGHYQSRHPGVTYPGFGGGHLYIVSEPPVPGAFGVKVRTKRS